MNIKNYGFDGSLVVETTTIDKDQNGFLRKAIKDVDICGDDVIFIDYDGTVLHSYNTNTFLHMSGMPANPKHNGLISRGWNWSYEDAKAYVQKYGKLNVGQMYVPADGKTHIKIHIPEWGSFSFGLCFTQTVANGVIVNWGDGSEPETNETMNEPVRLEHIYATDNTDFDITLETINECEIGYGYDNGESNGWISLFNSSQEHTTSYAAYMTDVIVSDSVMEIGNRAFDNCHMLQSLIIPDSVTSIEQNAFSNCYTLKSLTIPNSITSIGERAFSKCYLLKSLSIPNSVTNINSFAFPGCHNLQPTLTIPDTIISIGASVFNNCRSLQSLIIPDSVESIGDNAFTNCYNLQSLNIPDSVESIGMYAFGTSLNLHSLVIPESITNIGYMTFYNSALYKCIIQSTTPPTLGQTPFYSISSDAKFLVPAESVDTYKAASGWSTYAEQIFAIEEE